MTEATVEASFPVEGDLDLVRTCRPLSSGPSDPTWWFGRDRVARSRHTGSGPATVEVRRTPDGVAARAWGPGAEVALAEVPAMVGAADRADGFRPDLHPLVGRMARRRVGLRFGAGGSTWDAALPTVLGQRVTTREAHRSWWRLVRRHGGRAPGPLGLGLAPTPRQVAGLGVADWHVLGVERRRADAVGRIAVALPAIDRAARAGRDGSAGYQRVLTSLPGVGPWTATGLAASVLGDPDAVLLGDLHVPHTVCHALAGEDRGSDERMLELLAPWAGHRARVVRLVKGAGRGAPRRGPRYTPIPIARY